MSRRNVRTVTAGDTHAKDPAGQQPKTGGADAPAAGDASPAGAPLEDTDHEPTAAEADQHPDEQTRADRADAAALDDLIPYALLPDAGVAAHESMARRYGNWRIHAAWAAAYTVIDHIYGSTQVSERFTERCDQAGMGVAAEPDPELSNTLAAFVRQLGRERATPAVLAQQLVILGRWDVATIEPAEALVLDVFLNTFSALDAYEAEEARRQAAAAVRPAPVRKVPIEETTLEPTDGPFDVWRTA